MSGIRFRGSGFRGSFSRHRLMDSDFTHIFWVFTSECGLGKIAGSSNIGA